MKFVRIYMVVRVPDNACAQDVVYDYADEDDDTIMFACSQDGGYNGEFDVFGADQTSWPAEENEP